MAIVGVRDNLDDVIGEAKKEMYDKLNKTEQAFEDNFSRLDEYIRGFDSKYSVNINNIIDEIDKCIDIAKPNKYCNKVIIDMTESHQTIYPMIVLWYEHKGFSVERLDGYTIISWNNVSVATKIGTIIRKIINAVGVFFSDVAYAIREKDDDGDGDDE